MDKQSHDYFVVDVPSTEDVQSAQYLKHQVLLTVGNFEQPNIRGLFYAEIEEVFGSEINDVWIALGILYHQEHRQASDGMRFVLRWTPSTGKGALYFRSHEQEKIPIKFLRGEKL